MAVTLDRNLNLVVPIYDDDDKIVAWVHSTPISAEVYETYYKVIARTVEMIYSDVGMGVGPQVASLALRDAAKQMGIWDGPTGVEAGLVNEIRRLTMVVVPGPNGWQTIPYDDMIRGKKIDDDDAREVNNAITFFTLALWGHGQKRAGRKIAMEAAPKWGGHTTSSSITAFKDGLPTSIANENTNDLEAEVQKTRSSIPS